MPVVERTSAEVTPALYRTRVTHLRRSPVYHYFEHNSYSWYVDVDDLPRLPRGLRCLARFEATDHFDGAPTDTLRQRIDAFLAERDIDLAGGRITALIQPRVFGFAFNPVTFFWCHDAAGQLRHIIAEVQNARGERHGYLLPPDGTQPVMVQKRLYTSKFNGVDGYYLVRAPRPDAQLDLTVSLHRDNQPALVATMRGTRHRAGIASLLRMQLAAPAAPLMDRVSARVQAMILMMRGVPAVPYTPMATNEKIAQT
jgi:uncharacterized protein